MFIKVIYIRWCPNPTTMTDFQLLKLLPPDSTSKSTSIKIRILNPEGATLWDVDLDATYRIRTTLDFIQARERAGFRKVYSEMDLCPQSIN